MLLYLAKFSICLLIFMSFYKLCLERERMHNLKRLFLLAAVILSASIPLITFTTVVTYEPAAASTFTPIEVVENQELPAEITWQEYVPLVLWTLYWIGVVIFGFRFFRHLLQLTLKIKRNPKLKSNNFVHVLLNETVAPHTFFKYLFFNKTRYHNQEIPEAVFIHEQAHAKQLHALDILFIELFQIVFWFHPLVYMLKNDIKLNHEFLADNAVLQQGTASANYQQLLLAYSSHANHQLANAINYSSTRLSNELFSNQFGQVKKRFTIMNTKTSKTRTRLLSLLILPLIGVLVYSFSTEKTTYVERNATDTTSNLFFVTIEKVDNTLRLQCKDGCKWADISLENPNEPYIINDFGFSEGKTITTDKFTFKVTHNTDGISLQGLQGTTWNTLNFTLKDNETKAINKFGFADANTIIKKPVDKHFKPLKVRLINDNITINDIPSSVDTYKDDLNEVTKDWTDKNYKASTTDLIIDNCSEEFLKTIDLQFRQTDYFLIALQGSKTISAAEKAKSEKISFSKLNDTGSEKSISLSLAKSTRPVLKLSQNPLQLELNGKATSLSEIGKHFKQVITSAKSDLDIKATGGVNMSTIVAIMEATKTHLNKIYLDESAYIIEDRPEYNTTDQDGATKAQIAEYNRLAKHYNNLKDKIIRVKDYKTIKRIYKIMSLQQRKAAEPYPDFSLLPPPPPRPNNPPKNRKKVIEIIKEQPTPDTPVKVGNNVHTIQEVEEVIEEQPILDTPDNVETIEALEDVIETKKAPKIERLSHLENATYYLNGKVISKEKAYTINSNAIKSTKVIKKNGVGKVYIKTHKNAKNIYLKDGEKNNNLIPPPPPPPAKPKKTQKTGYIKSGKETLYFVTNANGVTYYNRWGQEVDKEGTIIKPEQTHASKVVEGQYIKKVYKDDAVVSEFAGELPPPPPPPKVPTFKELAKKGAIFYNENKQISAKQAIALRKQNPNLNIQIRQIDSEQPIVKLQKAPISAD